MPMHVFVLFVSAEWFALLPPSPRPTIVDDAQQLTKQFLASVSSPSRTPSHDFPSLEWTVHSSDLIVIGTVGREQNTIRPEQVLKPAGKLTMKWPPGDGNRLKNIGRLFRPGDRLVLCWRRDRAKKTWSLHDYFPLFSSKDSRRLKKGHNRYATKMGQAYHQAGFNWLAVGIKGRVIRDSKELLSRIKKRIALGIELPAGVDRAAVEARRSVYGGYWVYEDCELSAAEFPLILRPPTPNGWKVYLTSDESRPAAEWNRLINYRHPKVIAALKNSLKSDWVHERHFDANGNLVTSVSYKWGRDKPPRKPARAVKVVRLFETRKRAYELLTKLGVEVAKPRLHPND